MTDTRKDAIAAVLAFVEDQTQTRSDEINQACCHFLELLTAPTIPLQ